MISPLREQDESLHHRESEEPEEFGSEVTETDGDGERINEDADLNAHTAERRLPGRPRIVRTGLPGRPRKEFKIAQGSLVEEGSSEYANIAEIPLAEALSGNEAKEWKSSIREEFSALIRNETWELLERPKD